MLNVNSNSYQSKVAICDLRFLKFVKPQSQTIKLMNPLVVHSQYF